MAPTPPAAARMRAMKTILAILVSVLASLALSQEASVLHLMFGALHAPFAPRSR